VAAHFLLPSTLFVCSLAWCGALVRVEVDVQAAFDASPLTRLDYHAGGPPRCPFVVMPQLDNQGSPYKV
jgi:hypothetical protein